MPPVLLALCAGARSARMKLRLHPHNFQKLFNEEMINLWLKPKFWILLNFLSFLSLSPPLFSLLQDGGVLPGSPEHKPVCNSYCPCAETPEGDQPRAQ